MTWLALFLLTILGLPTTPFLVLLALPWASQTAARVFPPELDWLNTSDDPGANEGLYEPQVWAVFELPVTFLTWLSHALPASWTGGMPYSIRILQTIGFYLKTWYWLGVRNQLYGLFARLCPKYDGSPVTVRTVGPLVVYSIPGYSEWTYPGRRISFGWKVRTLSTARVGDPVWWVCEPAFWKSREY